MTLPLVVAGAARSGTAGLARAIASLLGRPLAQAGPALPLLAALREGAARRAAGLALARPGLPVEDRPPPALLEAALREWPDGAVLRMADLLPSVDHLRALHTVLEERPQARALCLWRNGIGFVASRRRALPHLSFAEHCLTWAASQEAIAALRRRFGERVMAVEHREMAEDAAGLARRLAGFCGVAEASLAALPALLAREWPGQASAAPPPLARTGWSMPEIELFAGLCGEAMAQAGAPLDMAGLLRARPLDLLAAIRAGEARPDGALGIAASRGPLGGVLLRTVAEGAGALRLPALSTAGRNRLELHITAGAQPMLLELRLEGSLTRRPLLLRPIRLAAGAEAELAARFPATDELVDLTLGVAPSPPGGFELRSLSLSGSGG